MKVRFLGFRENAPEHGFEWFTEGKIYHVEEVIEKNGKKIVWAYVDDEQDPAIDPMFEGEYEIVSEAE